MDMAVALKINAGVTGQQAVDQLRTSMDRMRDSVQGVSSRFGVLQGALTGLASAAVVSGFVSMIKSAIDMADKLNDLRQKTGIAVEDLDALGYAAELNGSNLDAVSGALGKLAKNMAEAAGGSKEALGVFKQFGISQAELKSGTITTTEAMARIADKLSTMSDGWEKTAAAQKVFGKSAADLVPLLNAGGGAIRDARTELEAMGALFTGSMAEAADEFNDNMTKLRRMSSALGLSLAKELMPVLNGFVLGLIESKSKADDLSGNTALIDWATVAAQGIAVLVDVVRVAAQGIYALVGSFQAVWADISLAGTFLKDGPTALFRHGGVEALKTALEERNQVVSDANQRYAKLWSMDGSQVLNAVTSAIEKQKNSVKPLANSPASTFQFDFGAGKETEFDKLKKQLEDQLVKTGDLTKAEEVLRLLRSDAYKDLTTAQRADLLNIAKKIDFAKLQGEVEKETQKVQDERSAKLAAQQEREGKAINDLTRSKQLELDLLALEANRVNMTTREYEMAVEAKQQEYAITQAVADMLPENAKRYKDVADSMFAAKQAAEQLNYEQSRTFEAGAKRALKSYADEISNVAQATENAMTSAFKGMEDALVEFAMTGKLSFSDLANSIIKDMIRIAIQQTIMKPLMGSFGGLFGGGGATTLSQADYAAISGFDGGGYTGNAPRSGGIDGKGGFMAIMHPQETVIDHTKGQTMGSNSVVVNVNVEGGQTQVQSDQGAGNLGRLIANAVQAELINQKRPGGLLAA